ncbi:MAG: YqgE/AlgH family protein [bacterium]|nr:YqgE/AlgH family protein [bacterium]
MVFAQGPRVGQFLVASETLADPRFAETVVLLLQADAQGTMGVVINRPTELTLSKVLDDREGVEERSDTLFFGGPVGINQIFLLLRTARSPEESKRVLSDVHFSTSRDVLKRIIEDGIDGETVRFMAGYAGWSQGQLDQEILRGDWHVLPGDSETVFQIPPSQIWPALIRRSSYQWVMAGERSQDSEPQAEGY